MDKEKIKTILQIITPIIVIGAVVVCTILNIIG
jgi:hypothetical protein